MDFRVDASSTFALVHLYEIALLPACADVHPEWLLTQRLTTKTNDLKPDRMCGR
ncbi:hypothetical protein RRSWK_05302 [Rhodopirellula sp. SWK7]|nr:hypothetical protein RRSWK_05302 [Rhodopirellula sp. SWK7]